MGRIQALDCLNNQHIQELEALSLACQEIDGHRLPFYPDLLIHPRQKPSTLLYQYQNHCIAFAAAMYFENDAAEIVLFVHPLHRRRGFGRACFRQLLHDIQIFRPVPYLIFPVPHDIKPVFKPKQGIFLNSEFEMIYPAERATPIFSDTLQVEVAQHADIALLCDLDERCFPNVFFNGSLRFESILSQTERYTILILKVDGEIIGKAHITWRERVAHLSDIAIFPRMQGRGYGRQLVSYCIAYARQKNYAIMTLSVEADNQTALNLYRYLGFEMTSAIDYWKYEFNVFLS